MTNEELQVHKEKIKEVMMTHLNSKGYPKLTNDQIMAELKPMWVLIEEAGLKVDGMSYKMFCAKATEAMMFNQMKQMFGI